MGDGIVSAAPKLGKRGPEPSRLNLGYVSIQGVFGLFVTEAEGEESVCSINNRNITDGRLLWDSHFSQFPTLK